jgi:hypothetical protein
VLGKKVTNDDIFYNFHSYVSKSKHNKNENLIIKLKNKFCDTITNFSNNLVQPVPKPKKSAFISSTKIRFNMKNPFYATKTQSKSQNKIDTKNTNLESKRKFNRISAFSNDNDKRLNANNTIGGHSNADGDGTINNEDDSYFTITESKVETKQVKQKNYFGYTKNNKKDLQQTFKRLEDINLLENNFFKSNNYQNKLLGNLRFAEVSTNYNKRYYRIILINLVLKVLSFQIKIR